MSIVYQNGLGDSLGDILVTCKPLYTSGNVWYVNSAGGVDGASPAGQNREKPLATLGQAIANSASNDIIELMSGHAETLTAGVTVNKVLTIVGGGSSGGLPTVKMTLNSAAGVMLTIGSSNVQLRNIWLRANQQTNASAKISVAAPQFRMVGCYFECGPTDTGAAVSFDSGCTSPSLENCTFISTATVVTAQPESAVKNTVAVTSGLNLDGCVFSGGTVGFSNYRAVDLSGFTTSQMTASNISLLLGADVKLNAASTGRWNVSVCTGGSRIDW